MSYNPHRKHDPEKGSFSARVLGASNMIGGAGVALAGIAARNPLIAAVGGAQYYAGARTYAAGVRRPANTHQPS